MSGFKSNLQEPAEFLPPTVNFTKPTGGYPKPLHPYNPDIWLDGQVVNGKMKMPAFHPILTTDYFEYGTSTNHLDQEGCAVEMGDAALGLALDERKTAGETVPKWAVVRTARTLRSTAGCATYPRKTAFKSCGPCTTTLHSDISPAS